MIRRGIGGHQRAYRGGSDEWLTPPEIIKALGAFDLDPCAPIDRPWDIASLHYTKVENGLICPWDKRRAWVNPPYGPQTKHWLQKLSEHGNGIALVFARTETEMFHDWVWSKATALFFFRGRLHFHYPNGERADFNAGGPSVLVAYGRRNANALKRATRLRGRYIEL